MGEKKTREELIASIMWNSGGCGFGICEVANMMSWATDRPGPYKPDITSIVAVSCPPDKYTDQELEEIAEFSKRATADYDAMNGYRRGANLICIGKVDGRWMRKRLTWTMGSMFSPTLKDAIAVFEVPRRGITGVTR